MKSSYTLCQIFSIGGEDGNRNVGSVYSLINEDGQVWESAGEIMSRRGHTCSHITTSAGEDRVIIVGGYSPGASPVQIYNPETGVTTRAGNGKISIQGSAKRRGLGCVNSLPGSAWL